MSAARDLMAFLRKAACQYSRGNGSCSGKRSKALGAVVHKAKPTAVTENVILEILS